MSKDVNVGVIICPDCEGYGRVKKCQDVGYHKTEWEFTKWDCKRCNTTGRLLKTITTDVTITEIPVTKNMVCKKGY